MVHWRRRRGDDVPPVTLLDQAPVVRPATAKRHPAGTAEEALHCLHEVRAAAQELAATAVDEPPTSELDTLQSALDRLGEAIARLARAEPDAQRGEAADGRAVHHLRSGRRWR